MINSKRHLFRLIIPAFSFFNVYSHFTKVTTSLGPICVATAADELEMWDVEVIDENNCRSNLCPKEKNGLPDHLKLQEKRPADVVGFYGSMSSVIPRLYKLAALYKKSGAKTVCGGKHVESLYQDALANNLDAVVIGEGEYTIKELLFAWQNKKPLANVAGIVFRQDGKIIKTPGRPLITDLDKLPDPDFDLLLYAKMKYYPVGRIRGCDKNCEFCTVKSRTRYATPQKVMSQVAYLVENKKARRFFEISDHFAADRDGAIEFCHLLRDFQEKVNIKLTIAIQTRINDAGDHELLQAMKEAGINNLAIGLESPIDEELKAMRKGYLSKDMIRWAKLYHDYGFPIHGMFIFGYPANQKHSFRFSLEEKVIRFRNFIKKARIDTVQVLLAVPVPGTDLWKRLKAENRIYPLDQIGWEYYDGQFPLFEPDDGISPKALQQAVTRIMSKTYRLWHLFEMVGNILIHFPRMIFLPSLSILTFRIKFISQTFRRWKKRYFRNPLLRFSGYIILKNWLKKVKKDKFLKSLDNARQNLYKKYKVGSYVLPNSNKNKKPTL